MQGCRFSKEAVWSSGMIPASGAGGPGFNPRLGPLVGFLIGNDSDLATSMLLCNVIFQWILILDFQCKNGAGGHRSPCLLHAKQALYHLSYSP